MLDVFVSDDQCPEDPLWLADHPPWREELLRPYLKEFTSPGALLLDPFARHTALLQVGQATGRRVLATNSNPLPLLQLRLTLSPPEPRVLDAIVSRLADTPRAGKPLSRHLDDLYLVYCPACTRALPADYIIWEAEKPVEKGFDCPHCGEAGAAPITPQDLDIQASVGTQEVIYWRLHQRLAASEETREFQERVQRLLNLYTARNRYALGELILQAEALFTRDDMSLDVIRGLCLACLQRCHSLHTAPDQADLPRSLHRPRRLVERNVWKTFEAAYRKLRKQSHASPITWAPDLSALLEPTPTPGTGPALALQRTTRELSIALKDHPRLPLICADPPRPDPTAHALAFLWSGWLFGREATLPLRSLVRRPSLDWEWYTEAMTGVLGLLHGLLADGGRLLLAFTTQEKELLPALLRAAARTDLDLEQSIHQLQGDTASGERMACRLLFRRPHRPVHRLPAPVEESKRPAEELALELQEEGTKAAQAALEVRGEPAAAAWLYPPICTRWSKEELLHAVPPRRPPFDPLAWLMRQLEAVLPLEGPVPDGLLRLRPSGESEEGEVPRSCWWLADPSAAAAPLSERVERVTVELLQDTLAWPQAPLHDELCHHFRGLSTPERPLLEACIASYSQELSPGYWQLRPEDWPEARAEAHRQSVRLLVQLGRRLDFTVWLAPSERARLGPGWQSVSQEIAQENGDRQGWATCAVIWHEGGAPAHGFALSDTAALSPWLEPPPPALAEVSRCIVVPGGRSGLLAFKLRCCPEYRRRLAAHGWMIVKQRHLRRLADVEDLDRAGWRARIGLDPIVQRVEEQLPLFHYPNPAKPDPNHRLHGFHQVQRT